MTSQTFGTVTKVFVAGSEDVREAVGTILLWSSSDLADDPEARIEVTEEPSKADTVLLVHAVDRALSEELRRRLVWARQAGVTSAIVFLDKCDEVPEEQKGLLDFFEWEIRELLASLRFPAKLVPFLRGFIPRKIEKQLIDRSVIELISILEAQPSRLREESLDPFEMSIDSFLKSTGRRAQIAGRVKQGTLSVGKRLEIAGADSVEAVVVAGINLEGSPSERVYPGDVVSLDLKGISQTDLTEGSLVWTPGYRLLGGSAKDLERGRLTKSGQVIISGARQKRNFQKVATSEPSAFEAGHGYFIVPVFYATDRLRSKGSSSSKVTFGPRRGSGELSYGIAQVSIPESRIKGDLPRPKRWQFWVSEDPAKHVTILMSKVLEETVFTLTLGNAVNESPTSDILVFIHGFNVTFDEAVRRAGQVAFDLDFNGPTLLFSWPSEGSIPFYPVDRNNIDWSYPHLCNFIQLILAAVGSKSVHVVSHSMGGDLLSRCLRELVQVTTTMILKQVVFAAPDIDRDIFVALVPKFRFLAERLTLYGSENDLALKASRFLQRYPRAGGGGEEMAVVEGVDSIDSSAADTSFLAHSYYGDRRSVLEDIFWLLTKGFGPDDRYGLDARERHGLRYWVYQP